MLENYIGADEAAQILKVHAETVKRLIRRRVLPAEKMGNKWIIARDRLVLFASVYSGARGRPRVAPPRFHLAGCTSGNVALIRPDVGESTARAIESFAAGEPTLGHRDSTPVHLDDYLRLLAAEAPVERYDMGLLWTFPDCLDYEHPAALVGSDTPAGDRLLARLTERGMPEALAALGFVDVGEFWAPWCVALEGDEIASIAFTVGPARHFSGAASAEVGVTTVPAFRGRGCAAAATTGWASLRAHAGRILFYGASKTNVSSQRVTQRLGLRFIGASLTIT